ncbi:MAG TPA: ATP phosphoribosyltransferase regulatory subunit [Myxococcales bacterium]|nr:ATP phosphoribosyltransferase regulatory subunit [Myxococcales bacterium]
MTDIVGTTPVGVRDFTPDMAADFYQLQSALTGTFEANGFQRVLTPAFELAHVFERGLSSAEASRLLRFVDPQNGEVLTLRSDITPQIARLIAGPMAHVKAPVRLCYFGRVFRLREHLEFQRRELAQAGVELIGPPGADADAEVIRVCADSLEAADVRQCHFSLGHVGILHAALGGLDISDTEAQELRALLLKKDAAGVKSLGIKRGIAGDRLDALVSLCTLYGTPDDVMERASIELACIPNVGQYIARIQEILAVLKGHNCTQNMVLDLGEMLGFGYYTGFVFHVYIASNGEAIASGGRYDTLIAKYGRDIPAAGFAIDEEGLTETQHRER